MKSNAIYLILKIVELLNSSKNSLCLLSVSQDQNMASIYADYLYLSEIELIVLTIATVLAVDWLYVQSQREIMSYLYNSNELVTIGSWDRSMTFNDL